MAIAIRESQEIEGIRPEDAGNDQKGDRVSLFADDSAAFVARREQIEQARIIIRQYEKATGQKLHDDKTKIMRIGKGRAERMTNKEVGVDFEIMTEDETERYLGDIVGNQVTEERRFNELVEKMSSEGGRWNREKIGIYGRAIIANTLLMSKVKFRADINPLSTLLTRRIRDEIRSFMWKGKKAGTRWEILLRPVQEGGVGLRDPGCVFDVAKVKMLVHLRDGVRQPWKKWVERKIKRVGRRWGVADVLTAQPTLRQRKELRENCLVERALKVWFEVGKGMTREQMIKKRGGEANVDVMSQKDRDELGLMIGTTWTPINKLMTKQIYGQLMMKRMKMKKYKPKQAHDNLQKIQANLTAMERDYWWRVNHNLVMTRKRESKYKQVQATCPVCGEEEEDMKHYMYDCPKVQELIERVKSKAGMTSINREQWALEAKNMTHRAMTTIAKARWIHHQERCQICMGKRKRMNTQIMMNRLEKAMAAVQEKEEKRERGRNQRK